jgi:phage baseplate assembly protein W
VFAFVPLEPEPDAAPWYSRIAKRDAGLRLEVMIVDTPAAVAISAAMSFVSIPPVPRLEPRVAVLTETVA